MWNVKAPTYPPPQHHPRQSTSVELCTLKASDNDVVYIMLSVMHSHANKHSKWPVINNTQCDFFYPLQELNFSQAIFVNGALCHDLYEILSENNWHIFSSSYTTQICSYGYNDACVRCDLKQHLQGRYTNVTLYKGEATGDPFKYFSTLYQPCYDYCFFEVGLSDDPKWPG